MEATMGLAFVIIGSDGLWGSVTEEKVGINPTFVLFYFVFCLLFLFLFVFCFSIVSFILIPSDAFAFFVSPFPFVAVSKLTSFGVSKRALFPPSPRRCVPSFFFITRRRQPFLPSSTRV